ncbi:hypothetical protein Fmac_018876 [Flemingia macrophylla]|uniref:G-patch domain-containing protein n=1 Tax=Flemingia macrophylla TaxID=520843 RepID=A0ABD1M886_9FABA
MLEMLCLHVTDVEEDRVMEIMKLLRFSTVHLHFFSTRAVTHLTVSGYFSGALHDPSNTFSKWPYGGFSWADHRMIRSISGSYITVDLPSYSTAGDGNLTVDLPSYSAAGDGNPTVVTKVIPFFSPRIVILVFGPEFVRFKMDYRWTNGRQETGGRDRRQSKREQAYEESLIEDLAEDFRLLINHKPTENVDLDNVEQASLDTQLTSSNIGFKLLQKMGWKGKGPSPLAIVVNIFELGKKPQQTLAKFAKLHGPIMRLKLGQLTTIVISSPDIAKEVLQTHDLLFSNRTIPQATTVHNHNNYSLPFLPVSPLWRDLRKICNNQLFNIKSLDASQNLGRKKVHELLNLVHASSLRGEAVDIGVVAFMATINFLSNTFFSLDFVNSVGESEEYMGIVDNLVRAIGTPNLVDFLPLLKMVDPQGIRRRSYVYLHFQVDLIVAGTDTTSCTIKCAMAELINNPNAMSKAKRELEQTVGIGNPVEESDIARLPYLHATIKETLRMHASAPLLLPRKAKMDVEINGYTIPKAAQILINVWAIGRNPGIWDNPNSFSPERFLGSEIDVQGRHSKLTPFGGGRRICPGLPLAVRMLHLTLGSLINGYDWKLENDVNPYTDMGQPLRVIPFRINK